MDDTENMPEGDDRQPDDTAKPKDRTRRNADGKAITAIEAAPLRLFKSMDSGDRLYAACLLIPGATFCYVDGSAMAARKKAEAARAYEVKRLTGKKLK